MPLDFSTMQMEVMERLSATTDRANTVRLRRWVNAAARQLDDEEDWEYLFTSTTGVAPLTIADLDTVQSVVDVVNLNPLRQVDKEALARDVADLTTAGLASYWYRTAPTVIATYPVSTATLTVKYFKYMSADMVASTDVPLAPDRFREAIVELACAKGYRDVGDANNVQGCLTEYARLLVAMRKTLLPQLDYIARTNYALDD